MTHLNSILFQSIINDGIKISKFLELATNSVRIEFAKFLLFNPFLSTLATFSPLKLVFKAKLFDMVNKGEKLSHSSSKTTRHQ